MLQLRYLCFVNTAGYVGEWYCQWDSNPRRPAENRVSLPAKRFPAKWKPVRVKKTHQKRNLEPRSGAPDDGSICSWLPPHDSNVPVSVNSGAPSPRWLDGNEMVEQRRVELRTSILQGSTAARCLPRDGAQRQI